MTTALSRITVPAAEIQAISARYGTDYPLDFAPTVQTVRRWAEGLRRDADDSTDPEVMRGEAKELDVLADRIEQEVLA